jgi:hypothetical protein
MQVNKGDYGELYTFNCVDGAGVVKNLTGYTAAKFKMWKSSDPSTLKVNGACSIVAPATSGVVTYTPVVADFDTAGRYIGEIELTAAGVVSSSTQFEVLVKVSG